MVELPRQETFGRSVESGRENEDAVPQTAEPLSQLPTRSPKLLLKRSAYAIAIIAAAGYAAHFGYDYWTTGRFIESTDDAYVKADYTTIAPKVAGYIKDVLVNDNDFVNAGQVLATIDDRDFQIAHDSARADLQGAEAAIANLDAQIDLQASVIEQARASVDVSKASYNFAKSDAARNARLTSNGSGTLSRAEQSKSILDQASAAVDRDQAALVSAQSRVQVLRTQRDQAVAQRDKATAAVDQAAVNLSYTRIVAAVDGTVGARSVRVGQFVSSGTQLMAVVPLHAVYIVANVKETQLTHMHPGQHAEIRVDSFPKLKIKGHVDSISPASGLEFSLLPPDNATGNFTKIVQRIPVKILIDDEGLSATLRSGMSVEPRIDTKDAYAPEAP